MKYQMAKILLYQYLYRIKDRVEIVVTRSGDDGWFIKITGEAPNIRQKCVDSLVRQDGYLRTKDGYIVTVDRYSTAEVIAALFDRLVDGVWEDVA